MNVMSSAPLLSQSFESAVQKPLDDLLVILKDIRKRHPDTTPDEKEIEHCIAGFLQVAPIAFHNNMPEAVVERAESYAQRLEKYADTIDERLNAVPVLRSIREHLPRPL